MHLSLHGMHMPRPSTTSIAACIIVHPPNIALQLLHMYCRPPTFEQQGPASVEVEALSNRVLKPTLCRCQLDCVALPITQNR